MAQLKALIAIQETVLNSTPEELGPDTPLLAKITGMRAAVLAGQKALQAKSGLINLEFSYGRWNGDDVRELEEPMLGLVTRVGTYQSVPVNAAPNNSSSWYAELRTSCRRAALQSLQTTQGIQRRH